MKHTKIVCTLGPSSCTKARLVEMIRAGMNVARLNFSHSDYGEHVTLINAVRQAAKETGVIIALMQDLQGPRLRVGKLPVKGVSIREYEKVVLLPEEECRQYRSSAYTPLPMQYSSLAYYVKRGQNIYIQDGIIHLKVDRVVNRNIYCHVIHGGTVFSFRGLNAPQAVIHANVFTKKDKEDLRFGIKHNVDFIALSFVRSAADIKKVRRILPFNSRIKIIAKIERREAVHNFDEILEVTDGIMVARGDLGVELNPKDVPLLQKEMVMKCLLAAKPVIVATQMLESMVENPRPTRAEAADVANAVTDHADAVMLSAETATGKFPVPAVRIMSAIAQDIEQSRFDDLDENVLRYRKMVLHREAKESRSVARAAVSVGESIGAKAIVVLSRTGSTATSLSQLRPQKIKITVFTDDEKILRQLSLVWGVRGIRVNLPKTQKEFISKARKVLIKDKVVSKGDSIVVVSGFGKHKGLRAIESVVV